MVLTVDVTAAVEVIAGLSPAERQRILAALAVAVCEYQRSQDPAVLAAFARDFSATVELHSDPDYLRALSEAPTTAIGPGRTVVEVFTPRSLRG